MLTLVAPSSASDTCRLAGGGRQGATRLVRAIVEVKGDLKVDTGGQRISRLPLQGRSTSVYHEKIMAVSADASTRRDARVYDRAEATYEVGAMRRSVRLADDRRLIVASAESAVATLYAPAGPLSRDELELIDIQGNTTLFERLLPGHEVRIGDRWKHADDLVGLMFGLDKVHQNDVQSTLRVVEQNLAIVDLSGSVRGDAQGVPSDIEVRGKYNVDLKQGVVTWFTLLVQEDRAISRAEPGFEVTARIRITVDPCDPPAALSDSALRHVPPTPNTGSLLLRFASEPGGFRLLHDRSWRTVVDRNEVTVLRLMDGDTQIAQCNISRLPDVTSGSLPTLESFQAEVRRALGERFGEFQESSQSAADADPRVLRVAVSGLAGGVAIQWTYYHVSDVQGRRASLVFTREGSQAERFGAADTQLVESFQMVDRAQTEAAAETAQSTSSDSRATR